MPSTILDKTTHQQITKRWATELKKKAKGKPYPIYSKEEILDAAKKVYFDMPDYFKSVEHTLNLL